MAKLPILMYHKVSASESSGLTISVEKLEEQFRFISESGYTTYHLSELLDYKKLPSKKNIIITFDDGYVSQLSYAVPLLEKYNLKATFFIPLQYVGKVDDWNSPSFPIMSVEQLQSLNPTVVELGYHSYAHKKYTDLSQDEIEKDTLAAFTTVEKEALPFGPVLAYPYGKFPRKNPEKNNFFKQLKKHQFKYGLRIGNRINTFPFKNPFEINRLDVKGEYSLQKFKRKIRLGKLI